MSMASRLLLFPARASFIDEVAARIVALHRDRLPDLSALTLVVAGPALLKPLRVALATAAGGALLLPRIITAGNLAAESLPDNQAPPLSALECRLRLAEALSRFRSIFPGQDPLRVADALYAIFDELVLNAATLPEDEAGVAECLRVAYGAQLIEPLSREAQIVHRLWRAYVEEIGDRAPAVAYLAGLRAALNDAAAGPTLWLGFDALTQAEAVLIRPAIAAGRVWFWTQGRSADRDGASLRALFAAIGDESPVCVDVAPAARSALLDACYADSGDSSRERAATLAADCAHGLRYVPVASPEQEARCVDLAIREAVLSGAQTIAVVSPDRRLARRLRALLERADLSFEDRVGWALSTSRAAAALSSWLECLERRFQFRPLLDLLKCGFFPVDDETGVGAETALAARLEAALLARRDAARPAAGLEAFRQLLDGRYPAVFERLQRAAAELPLHDGSRPGLDWAEGLAASLRVLGLAAALAEDDAGSQVHAVLNQLRAALAAAPLRMRWRDFRSLLDRSIEAATFKPAIRGQARVALYTLEQTQGLRADRLILASATRAQLPGSPAGEAFFNQTVRRELGLPTWPQRQAQTLSRLRRVLEAAPEVVVTYAGSEGEPPQLSPWLDALEAFAIAAGSASLHDAGLAERAMQAAVDVAEPIDAAAVEHVAPLPRPAPFAAAPLLEFSLSASGHQSLIDCPYRWYASRLLRLAEESAPDEDPSRADYGQRVHLVLAAFHAQVDPSLPAPYGGSIVIAARDDIAAKLAQLADAVFAADLAARPLARVWRQEFTALQPFLIEQLIAAGGAGIEVETERRNAIAGWELYGRLDRLQTTADATTVVDYKTGAVPKKEDVAAGESVQLPHYALEAGAVGRVEYWDLKERKRTVLDGEALIELTDAIVARLDTMHGQLAAGQPLPAHGDDRSCGRCEYAGVCRNGAWAREPARA